MATSKKDPSAAIRLKASRYPGVDEGTACTQSSFKAGKKSFLFIGMQGGRHKAMFKLQDSLPEAAKLAKKNPDDYQVGSSAWVTARFTAEQPMPKKLWEKWLDESYRLALGAAPVKGSTRKKSPAKTSTPKTSTPKTASKKTASKKTASKKSKSRARK